MTSVFHSVDIRMFSGWARVTLVAILLYDMNDSDLQLLLSDIISDNSCEKCLCLFFVQTYYLNEREQFRT